MSIISNSIYISVSFLLIVGFFNKAQDTQLLSGFYFIDETTGIERILENTQEYFFISPTSITPISTIDHVKTEVIKTKVHKKTEKNYGLHFQLNDQGQKAMQLASKKAYENKQRIALIVNDSLVLAPYINYEIINGSFFIEIDSHEKEIKALEKHIKSAIKTKN